MAVKEYRKSTSASTCTGVDEACGCIPGIPNFVNKYTIVNSVNGMTGDVILDLNATFIYEQTSASDTWTINHSLGRYPSVTVVDSAGSVISKIRSTWVHVPAL